MNRFLGFNLIILTAFLGMAVWAQPARAVNWSKCQVQQGETTIPSGSATYDLSLQTPLTDPAQAFVLSYSSGSSSVQQGYNHMVNSAFVGTSILQFTRGGNSGPVNVSYSVIECFENEFAVQAGTITINTGTNANTSPDLLTSVDLTHSMVLVTTTTNDNNSSEVNGLVTGTLEDDNTVKVQRSGSGSYTTTAKYQVITFADTTDVIVQTGEVILGSASPNNQSVTTALATEVDPARTWVYCSYDASNNGLMQTSVACDLTDEKTITVRRYAEAKYTNRIRYYTVSWPNDSVLVYRGSESSPENNTDVDGARVEHEITINSIEDIKHAFSYVMTTVKGAVTTFPRNRWIYYLSYPKTLYTAFWRNDKTSDTDDNIKYWQVIQFPAPYQATGWGWIGSSVDNTTGTALISFDCDNLTEYYADTGCGDGTTTRYDYGVSLEHGGCGTVCDVTGTAWIGLYDNADTSSDGKKYTLGIITFDPDSADMDDANAPPQQLGNDPKTIGEDERSSAKWNEETNELYGWARFTALEDYEQNNPDVTSTQNNWGWIKLRGTVDDGSFTEYGVDFDPVTSTFAEGSWAWNDNGTAANGTTELDGSGFGWVRFDLGTSGTVSQAWLKTSQGDVYSQGGINVTTDPATYGDFGSTYLILADGSVSNFTSEHGSVSTSTDLGTVPTDIGSNIYRGAIGTIHVNELIDHPVQPLYVYDGDCDDDWLRDFTNPLSGAVYYCTGDMTINNNLTFYNASGAGLGTGTIVVGGNLYINDNIGYYNNTIDQNINNLASVAFIVQGRVEINPGVTNLVGAYIVLGDANPSASGVYDFATGGSNAGGYNAPLELAGLVMARSFHFQRNSKGSATNPQPSEHIYYDGRIFASTPPGLEDLAAILPSFN